jgi:hypothetical protein
MNITTDVGVGATIETADYTINIVVKHIESNGQSVTLELPNREMVLCVNDAVSFNIHIPVLSIEKTKYV